MCRSGSCNPKRFNRLVGREEEGGGREQLVLHCLLGEPVHTFLQALRSFLAANPREFLILDFQHLYQFTGADHAAILRLMQTLFTNKICPCPARQADIVPMYFSCFFCFFGGGRLGRSEGGAKSTLYF